MVPSDPSTWKTQGWAYNMEIKKESQPPDFNPYLGDSDVSSRSGNKDEDWDTWMGINGIGGEMGWISYEEQDQSL